MSRAVLVRLVTLERVNEFNDASTVGRERVGHAPALIFLIDQSRLYQSSRVLRYRLDIAAQSLRDIFKRYPLRFIYLPEDLYPPVIRDPLQVPLQLFRRFHTIILRHSNILENVRMFIRFGGRGERKNISR